MRNKILWTSKPYQIGLHVWRVGVGVYDMRYCGLSEETRCTFYQYVRAEAAYTGYPEGAWKEGKDWPSYDHNDTYNGMPKRLGVLYDRNKKSIDFWLGQTSMAVEEQGELML